MADRRSDPVPVPISIRLASPADAPAIAEVWLRSFGAQFPNINRPHTDDQVRDWIVNELVPTHETWVADDGGLIVGFMALTDDMLDQLYIDVGWQGRGLGDRFVALAKERRPGGLELYAFQVNERARRFYARRGFVEVELTDGARNEEREPDVRLEWRPERDSTPQG